MPLYEFSCSAGHRTERTEKFGTHRIKCECGRKAIRILDKVHPSASNATASPAKKRKGWMQLFTFGKKQGRSKVHGIKIEGNVITGPSSLMLADGTVVQILPTQRT